MYHYFLKIQDELIEKGYGLLREAAELELDDKKMATTPVDAANIYLTLYRYCDKYVRLSKGSDLIIHLIEQSR